MDRNDMKLILGQTGSIIIMQWFAGVHLLGLYHNKKNI